MAVQNGLRGTDLLDAAINRPFGGFGDKEFYPSPEEKAAAIIESIVKNHPFLDGNKRMEYALMRLILMLNGKNMITDEDEKYDFVIQIASGTLNFEQILDWIKENIITTSDL